MSQHWEAIEFPLTENKKTCLPYIVNARATDDETIHGTRALAACSQAKVTGMFVLQGVVLFENAKTARLQYCYGVAEFGISNNIYSLPEKIYPVTANRHSY